MEASLVVPAGPALSHRTTSRQSPSVASLKNSSEGRPRQSSSTECWRSWLSVSQTLQTRQTYNACLNFAIFIMTTATVLYLIVTTVCQFC